MTVENVRDDSAKGTYLGIPGEVVDQLRAIESFQMKQSWNLFKRPATMMRSETVKLAKDMRDVTQNGQQTAPRLITGSRGVGKSIFMLQAHAMAFLNGWIVIHFPAG